MVADQRDPWNPDHRWADALILILGLLIACLLLWRLGSVRTAAPGVPTGISAQARLIELGQAARDLAQDRLGDFLPQEPLEQLSAGVTSPWDRALCAVLAAEAGKAELGRSLAKEQAFPGGEAFRRCYAAAYLGQGNPPDAAERASVSVALRGGYAARLLEARLASVRAPAAALRLREQARAWALPRLAGLAAAGLAMVVLVPSGLAVAILLGVSARSPRPFPLPELQLPGRGLALAFLGWFLAFLSSGLLLGPALDRLPALRPFTLPVSYGFHALLGLAFLVQATGCSLRQLSKQLLPGAHLRSLAWGFALLAMAVSLVLAVSLALNPFLKQPESPQQELMNLVAGTQGLGPLLVLFLTVSVAAPVFEETLFRGILLPWLGHRLKIRLGARTGWTAALLLSSLGFGIIHLQPMALPVLSALGLALGLAFLHTRHLGTPILVHGLWNGGVFLFYRIVMG